MALRDEVRPGLAGYWDRFVGPGASTAENIGTLGLSAAGVLWGDAGLDHTALTRYRVLMRLLAADLWGGVWVNNTRTCVKWYERPGQGARQHLGFAALHLLHPALIAQADHADGRRSRASATRWVLGHYALMLGAAALIANTPRRARLPIAAVSAVAGLVMDHRLGRSTTAPWFAPVYYTKLLIGHAAGSVWNRPPEPWHRPPVVLRPSTRHVPRLTTI